jgi:hypothetical protein
MLSAIEKKLINLCKLKPLEIPKIPSSRIVNVADDVDDAHEGNEHICEDIGAAYFITYKKSDNSVSKRRVLVRKISKSVDGNVILGCYCYERKAQRTFRVDRVIEAVDLATGEVIQNLIAHLNHVSGGGMAPAHAVSETSKILSKHRYPLNILIFLGRCDGRLHRFEIDIIYQYLMDIAFEASIDEKEVESYIGRHYPDHEVYLASISKLTPKKELQRIAKFACRMIEADEIITPAEHQFVEEMQEHL